MTRTRRRRSPRRVVTEVSSLLSAPFSVSAFVPWIVPVADIFTIMIVMMMMRRRRRMMMIHSH